MLISIQPASDDWRNFYLTQSMSFLRIQNFAFFSLQKVKNGLWKLHTRVHGEQCRVAMMRHLRRE